MDADKDNSSPARPAALLSVELQQASLPLQPQTGQQPPPQTPVQESQADAFENVASSEQTNAAEPRATPSNSASTSEEMLQVCSPSPI